MAAQRYEAWGGSGSVSKIIIVLAFSAVALAAPNPLGQARARLSAKGHEGGAPEPEAPADRRHQKLAFRRLLDREEAQPDKPGKMSNNETCEWFDGRYAVVCRSSGKSPMGPMKGIGIMGYNTDEKVYTYYGVDNSPMNMASVPKGTIAGETWTFNDEAMMGGKKVKSRFVLNLTSPTSYTFKWEIDEGAGKGAPIMEGTATKKGATKKD
jgi:hypothetical protein